MYLFKKINLIKIKMYIDILKAHYKAKNEEQISINYDTQNSSRFSGIYKPDEISSSSSDDGETTFGSRKLSTRKSQKLLNYLLVEINSSR